MATLSDEEIIDLDTARALLENPGLAIRLSHLVGTPLEKGLELLPVAWSDQVGEITRAALLKASSAALATLQDRPGAASSNRLHKLGAVVSGGVGGALGMAGIAVELPLSTTIMLRSIADVARSEGESLSDPATRVACLEVFALGGRSDLDDAAESGYFAARAALARSVSEASGHLLKNSISDRTAPALVRLIARIAERFGVQVTQKAAAQAIPAIGAAGGAAINALFMDHFQNAARGHFIIRRLERIHGEQAVRTLYLEESQ
jgi:hypothetical protein